MSGLTVVANAGTPTSTDAVMTDKPIRSFPLFRLLRLIVSPTADPVNGNGNRDGTGGAEEIPIRKTATEVTSAITPTQQDGWMRNLRLQNGVQASMRLSLLMASAALVFVVPCAAADDWGSAVNGVRLGIAVTAVHILKFGLRCRMSMRIRCC